MRSKIIFSRLTEEQYAEAQRVARATGRTLSDLVRVLVTHAEPIGNFGFRMRPEAVEAERPGE